MGSELAPATCNVGPVDVGDSNVMEFPQGWIVPCRLDIPIPRFFFWSRIGRQTQWPNDPPTTIWGEFLEALLPRFYHPLAFWCLWNFRLCLSNDLFNPAAERWWKPRLSWRHFQGATPVDSEGGWWEQSPGQIQFLGRRCQKKRWKRKGGIKSTVQCMNTLLFGSYNPWNCPNDSYFRFEWCFSRDVQFFSSNRGCSSQKVAFCVLKCRNDCKMQGYLDIPLIQVITQWLWINSGSNSFIDSKKNIPGPWHQVLFTGGAMRVVGIFPLNGPLLAAERELTVQSKPLVERMGHFCPSLDMVRRPETAQPWEVQEQPLVTWRVDTDQPPLIAHKIPFWNVSSWYIMFDVHVPCISKHESQLKIDGVLPRWWFFWTRKSRRS